MPILSASSGPNGISCARAPLGCFDEVVNDVAELPIGPGFVLVHWNASRFYGVVLLSKADDYSYIMINLSRHESAMLLSLVRRRFCQSR